MSDKITVEHYPERFERLREIYDEIGYEIEQVLGKALGYPEAYPDVSDVDDGSVCVGEHIIETLAAEAAKKIIALKDENQKLKEEVERLRSMTEWQEIETAPKDGSHFFGLVENERRLCMWGKTSHIPLYGWILIDQGVEDCDLCEPTKWYPFPSLES